jgi:hypothetical protein
MTARDIICAYALAALPEIGSDGDLPADIQVFPPGKDVPFTLQDYPGQQFFADIDGTTADRLNTDLQNRLARAQAGNGSLPFADKNHEDAEKTFTPLRYFWGGDDPVKGRRARGAGVDAVRRGLGAREGVRLLLPKFPVQQSQEKSPGADQRKCRRAGESARLCNANGVCEGGVNTN